MLYVFDIIAEIPIHGFKVVDVIARPDGTYSTILQFEQVAILLLY